MIDWTAVSAVVGALSVVVALVVVWLQLRNVSNSIRSSTYQGIVGMFDDFSKLLIDEPRLIEAVYPHATAPAQLPDPEFARRVDWVIGIRFVWFESVAVQSQDYGLLSPDVRNHWRNVLKHELTFPTLRDHWDRHGPNYHPALRKLVEEIAREEQAPAAPGHAG